MRIFLPSIDHETEVENAIRVLRRAKISVGSGALISQDRHHSYGAINLSADTQAELALEVLRKAGIKASLA